MRERLPTAQEIVGKIHGRLDFLQCATINADRFARHLVLRQSQLDQRHVRPFDRDFRGPDIRGNRVRLQNRHRILPACCPFA